MTFFVTITATCQWICYDSKSFQIQIIGILIIGILSVQVRSYMEKWPKPWLTL